MQTPGTHQTREYLNTETRFDIWIKRMLDYGFTENKDFVVMFKNVHNSKGGRNPIDYALTIECAKEIGMIQRTAKGKEIRDYFLECEKQLKNAKEISKPMSQSEILLHSAQLLVDIERRQNVTESKILEIEAKIATRPDYFTVMGFAILTGQKVGLALAAQIGKKAKSICNSKSYSIEKIHDPRFGLVGCYPKEVLHEAFSYIKV